MNQKPILGDMQIVDMGGNIVVLFQNKAQDDITYAHCNKTGAHIKNTNDHPFIGYTYEALHGIGRNHLQTQFMHPDDQQKIAGARKVTLS